MKQKLFFILLQIILAGILLIGLLLIWASFQPFATLASLLNHLASDGEFESFNVFIYQTLKFPFALMGAVLASLAGLCSFDGEKRNCGSKNFLPTPGVFSSCLAKMRKALFRMRELR